MPTGILVLFFSDSIAGEALGVELDNSLDSGIPTAFSKALAALRSCTWETVDLDPEMTAGSVEGIFEYAHAIW